MPVTVSARPSSAMIVGSSTTSYSPAKTPLEAGLELGRLDAVRNPTRPKFTPSAGRRCRASAAARAASCRRRRARPAGRPSAGCAATSTPHASATRPSRAGASPIRSGLPCTITLDAGHPHAQALAMASAIARSTSTARSSAAGCPAAATYTTYSRFPAGPGTKNRTRRGRRLPSRVTNAQTPATPAGAPPGRARRPCGRRPGRPRTAASPARAPATAGSAQAITAGSTSRSEMNETSAVISVGA